MRRPQRSAHILLAALVLAVASPVASQLQAQQGFMSAMHRDISDVQKKHVDLANAIPESAFG